jgi:hypothetical protein
MILQVARFIRPPADLVQAAWESYPSLRKNPHAAASGNDFAPIAHAAPSD